MSEMRLLDNQLIVLEPSTRWLEWRVWYLCKRDAWRARVMRRLSPYLERWQCWKWMLMDTPCSTRPIETLVCNRRAYMAQRWCLRVTLSLLFVSVFINVSHLMHPPVVVTSDYGLSQAEREVVERARATAELSAMNAAHQETRADLYENTAAALTDTVQRQRRELVELRRKYVAARITAVNPEAPADQLAPAFVEASDVHGVPLDVLLRIGAIESHYDPGRVSGAGARGVMQVMPYWSRYCPDWDGAGNIHCAARILKYECRRMDSFTDCLARYNGAETPGERRRYVGKYMAAAMPAGSP